MRTHEGNYVICSFAGKICYTAREAGLVMNGFKKHVHRGNHQWGKSSRGKSKFIPRRKYYCKECGYYHLTHKAFYTVESRKHAWEDVFYRECEKRRKRVGA